MATVDFQDDPYSTTPTWQPPAPLTRGSGTAPPAPVTIGSPNPSGWQTLGTDTSGGDQGWQPPTPTAPVSQPYTPPPAPLTTPTFGGQYQWQQTPAGQSLFNRMKQAFPDMSDAEIAQHLNTPTMPDERYFGAITTNIANQRRTTAATAPAATNPSTTNGNYQQWFSSLVNGKPVSTQTLQELGPTLEAAGWHLSPANANHEITKVQAPDGHWYSVQRSDNGGPLYWGWVDQGTASGPSPTTTPQGYSSQFADPATQQLEQYASQWLNQLGDQRSKIQGAFPVDRLIEFLNQRFGQLTGPAYSPQEQEILKTQLSEPIEANRSASKQRGLQYASQHGWGADSGVTADFLNQIDSGFDQQRNAAQGQLAMAEVGQQRQNSQEAQQLLMSLYGMGNDTWQTGLPISSLLYQLPQNAQQQALAALGMAPSPQDLYQQSLQLYGINQQQRNQSLPFYQNLGAMLPYLIPQGR